MYTVNKYGMHAKMGIQVPVSSGFYPVLIPIGIKFIHLRQWALNILWLICKSCILHVPLIEAPKAI